jgi:hypothetical protein
VRDALANIFPTSKREDLDDQSGVAASLQTRQSEQLS